MVSADRVTCPVGCVVSSGSVSVLASTAHWQGLPEVNEMRLTAGSKTNWMALVHEPAYVDPRSVVSVEAIVGVDWHGENFQRCEEGLPVVDGFEDADEADVLIGDPVLR